MPRISDLRDYLSVLESLGDVEHIDRPVSAVLEAAAITRRSTEQGRPAPLFDHVEGAQPRAWRDRLPAVTTTGIVHRIGELMSANRVGHMCPVTYVLDDDIDPSNISDVLWALGTRIHPTLRQRHWPVPILPWYQCYTEEERHGARGPIVVHDGLLTALEEGEARPATFDSLYPAEIRERVLAAESH